MGEVALVGRDRVHAALVRRLQQQVEQVGLAWADISLTMPSPCAHAWNRPRGGARACRCAGGSSNTGGPADEASLDFCQSGRRGATRRPAPCDAGRLEEPPSPTAAAEPSSPPAGPLAAPTSPDPLALPAASTRIWRLRSLPPQQRRDFSRGARLHETCTSKARCRLWITSPATYTTAYRGRCEPVTPPSYKQPSSDLQAADRPRAHAYAPLSGSPGVPAGRPVRAATKSSEADG